MKIKVEDKKKKKRVEDGNAYIRAREQRASKLAEKTGQSVKAAREQASKELSEKENKTLAEKQKEEQQTPEAIAQKQLDIDAAKKEIIRKRQREQGVEVTGETLKDNQGEYIINKAGEKEYLFSGSVGEVTAGDIAGLAAGGLGGKVVKGVAGKVAGKAAQKAEDLAFKKAFAAGKQFQKNKISNFASKFPTTTKDIIAYGKQPVFKETVKSSFGKLPMNVLVKRLSVVAGGISGIDAIATWAAVDNIASATSFQMTKVEDGVRYGELDRDTAITMADQAQKHLDFAKEEINKSTRWNPILWVARKRYMAAADVAQDSIDRARLFIEQNA